MPLKCQTASDPSRGVTDEIRTKAGFNQELEEKQISGELFC